MPSRSKWTVLTFIAAHNDLGAAGLARRSFDQIIGVGSTPDVTHGVLIDTHAGAGRYVVGAPGLALQQELLGPIDSGDPDCLAQTATWLFSEFPAEHYALVLWSHGSGWQPEEIESITQRSSPAPRPHPPREFVERSPGPGSRALFRTSVAQMMSPASATERAILFDDGTGHSLDTLELARAMKLVREAIGQPLDLLGMDACLMASLEVAYELRDSVRCLVASPELVPGHSWPYDAIFNTLRADPQVAPIDLAQRIVAAYADYYAANPPGLGDVTKVALDLDRIGELAQAWDALAAALLRDVTRDADAIWKVQIETRKRETRDGKRRPSKFDYHLWDLGALSAAIAMPGVDQAGRDAATRVSRVLQAGQGPVLLHRHLGEWLDGTAGVSVYAAMPRGTTLSSAYGRLALARDTRWAAFLNEYHSVYS